MAKGRSRRQAGGGTPPADLEKQFGLAVEHHRAGRLRDAERAYRRIMTAAPDQPFAAYMLGLIAHESGRNDRAVNLLNKALVIKPDFPEALNALGMAYKDLGRSDDAVKTFERALGIKSDYAEALSHLGNTLRGLGRPDEAVKRLERAVTLNPDFAGAHSNLGLALQDLGKLEEAYGSFQKAIEIEPELVEAYNNLGLLMMRLARFDAAESVLRKAVEMNPDFALAHNNLGNALLELGRPDEAVECYRQSIAANSRYAEPYVNLGALAIEHGIIPDAETHLRKALSLRPNFGKAHRYLSLIVKHADGDRDIAAMEKAMDATAASGEDRMHLSFGLGKAYEDLGNFEAAFGHFAEGNRIASKSAKFSIQDEGRVFEHVKSTFDAPLFEQLASGGCPDETPIFVLGMPRSGTTLVEQVLASHPEAAGGGELRILPQLVSAAFRGDDGFSFPAGAGGWDKGRLEKLGTDYARALRKIDGAARRITDKMPSNFLHVGLIRLALPNARIIHCRRDPLDTCLSIFKTFFTAGNLEYAYSLSDLGGYYALYRDLMAHWDRVLPGAVHHIAYEDLVADQETETRKLLDHCGLDWNDACLVFHKTERPVRTASAEQVRRPIYRDSVQAWKRYEKELAPLVEILGV